MASIRAVRAPPVPRKAFDATVAQGRSTPRLVMSSRSSGSSLSRRRNSSEAGDFTRELVIVDQPAKRHLASWLTSSASISARTTASVPQGDPDGAQGVGALPVARVRNDSPLAAVGEPDCPDACDIPPTPGSLRDTTVAGLPSSHSCPSVVFR
jgi:hypothetical protein